MTLPGGCSTRVFVFQSATNSLLFGARILEPDPSCYGRFKPSLKMGRHGTTVRAVDNAWMAMLPPLGIEPGRAAW
jgi:hypothetical protein